MNLFIVLLQLLKGYTIVMKKIAVFLLTFFVIMSSMPYISIVQGVEDISVEVQPRRISARAGYKINMKLEKPLQVHDWIKIIWPKGTTLPELPENKSERNKELTRIVESIYIGTSPCSACQGLPVIDYRENSIRFNIHLELDPKNLGYEYVYIHVTERVGIKNPQTPGQYQLKIQTQSESDSYDSHSYEIVDSKIGKPTGTPVVEVNPNGINHKASYSVSFTTGRGGELFMNRSRIRMQFPLQTTLLKSNQEIPLSSIRVNGKALGQMPMILDTTITILTPLYIGNSESVEVQFDQEAGILNPSSPGSYQILVSTSEDPEAVHSNTYEIIKQNPSLEVIPPITNKKAAYHFTFVADQDIEEDYPIYVLFPQNSQIPRYVDPSYVLINHTVTRSITVRNSLLMISSPKNIAAGNIIDVFIQEEAGIQNPPLPGSFLLEFKWFDEQSWEKTQPIEIIDPIVEFIDLAINPSNADEIATITCTIRNSAEALKQNDSIEILFSDGFTIPAEIKPSSISIAGESAIQTKSSPHSVNITIPNVIASEAIFDIIIHKSAKIKNPSNGDQMIHLSLSTPSTKEPIKSPSVYLYPPIPSTSVLLLEGKKGNQEWYTVPPLFSFQSNQKDIEVYFWFDEETETQLYHKPMALEVGQYVTTLYYYAQNSYEKGSIQEATIKVDTIVPELSISKPIQPVTYTSQNDYLVEGRILTQGFQTPQSSQFHMDVDLVTINGDSIEFVQDEETLQYNFESKYPLQEGSNDINIAAYDKAGNSSVRNFQIIRDTQPPDIQILFPTADQPSMEKTFEIKGKTEPFTELYILDELVFVDVEGAFTFPIRVDTVGKTLLDAEAIDKSGNRTTKTIEIWAGITLKLTIGSTTTDSNDMSTLLDLAPYIFNGRTMVPFRYIGESLQAEIQFSSDPMTKKVIEVRYTKENIVIVLHIGKNTAYVNNQAVTLDAVPSIVNGRTMVPLRFIAEELGCALQWENDTQEIIITYPTW
jgi:hypothetical protein